MAVQSRRSLRNPKPVELLALAYALGVAECSLGLARAPSRTRYSATAPSDRPRRPSRPCGAGIQWQNGLPLAVIHRPVHPLGSGRAHFFRAVRPDDGRSTELPCGESDELDDVEPGPACV